MKPDPKIFDDLARMAGGAVNIFSGLQQQIREEIRSRVDEMLTRMDVVPREDFERLEAMVAKLRLRQEELEKQLNGDKTTPAKKSPAPKKAAPKKATAKKPAPKKKK
ncbi:MAG: accessory factor UbiK family protein [Alphaproteobacteria bacterium]|nr:accessory factor UbiK family protein [Alphaproteobacteria bacterium]